MSDADSVEVNSEVEQHSGEPEGGNVFDMEGAVETLGTDLFPNSKEHQEEEAVDEVTDDASDETTEETTDEHSEEIATKAAPQSWKKDMHESWAALDPAVQDYIETRENQMKEGLEADRGDANLGRMMRDVMTPYADMLQQQQIDEPTAVKYLMNAHYNLTNAPQEQKLDMITRLAESYGIKLDGQPVEVDPKLQAIEQELYGLKSQLNDRAKADLQVARERVETEVNDFAQDPKHPYFEEVEDDLAKLITAGFSLEDAYEKAVWANPLTRQKEMDRLNQEKEQENLKKAQEKVKIAKKAKGPNVKSRDTNRTPTESLGTMEDTIRATYQEIQGR